MLIKNYIYMACIPIAIHRSVSCMLGLDYGC